MGRVKQRTRYRLQAARQAALARYREPQQPVFGLAWAGNAGLFFSRGRLTIAHYLIAAALLVMSAAGITYWQVVSDDDTDIEISLLTGELPINAYLDSEFEAWLKRSSE